MGYTASVAPLSVVRYDGTVVTTDPGHLCPSTRSVVSVVQTARRAKVAGGDAVHRGMYRTATLLAVLYATLWVALAFNVLPLLGQWLA